MDELGSVQKFLLSPLSKFILQIIHRFNLFKLINTLMYLGGFMYCFMLMDFRRCGLIPRNIIPAGLLFYALDLAQHLVIHYFKLSDEIVNKVFTKHHPYKLEAFYTLKITFTAIEVIFCFLVIGNLKHFNSCPQTNVFVTGYIAVFGSIHLLMLIAAACCGEVLFRMFRKLENIAQGVLLEALRRGADFIEEYVEDKLEPIDRLIEGRERITKRNRERIIREEVAKHYDQLLGPGGEV